MTAVSPASYAAKPRRIDVVPVLLACLAVVLSGLAVAVVVLSGQPGDQFLVAIAGVLAITVPISVGLSVWHTPEYARFGRLLILLGVLGGVPVLAHSSNAVLYSIGRVGFWVVELLVVFALLALPSGRLTETVDRVLVATAVSTVLLLFVPTAFVVERYPAPSLWTTCHDACPENAFMITATEPAFVEDWIHPAREVIVIGLYVAIVAVLARRLRKESELGRLMVASALALAILRSLTMAGALSVRLVDEDAIAVDALIWIFALCLPGVAVAFAVGLVRTRLFVGEALQQLPLRLRSRPGAAELRDILASTLRDPTLAVAYWAPGPPRRWLDASGHVVVLPADGPERGVTEVREGGRPVAALVHDPALRRQRPFVEAAGRYALAELENQRLRARVESSLESLRESRARIQEAADEERRRIERDLHDGAQQHLVALRMRLEIAADALVDDPGRGLGLIRRLGEEVEETLEDVRSLARGIYPSLLADQGLGDALAAAARRSPLPASVDLRGVERYPAAIESAVYFSCLEALQNAAKHADATAVAISVESSDGTLRFEVRDDGIGFDPAAAAPGAGLVNMRDRIGAVGGKLTVDTWPGAGSRIVGVVPVSERR